MAKNSIDSFVDGFVSNDCAFMIVCVTVSICLLDACWLIVYGEFLCMFN